MTEQDLEDFLAAVARVRAEHAATPEKARAFLMKEGVVDKDGELTGHYARKNRFRRKSAA
ncbi:hypothetical protein [Roseixanthobacter glucoisosaccharinicivorans]|uniref:hypothetical protein n=1 Tax=Roseixanthobacter glucoisosaccharinicivorans TaxID=3119923 RepID=UPI00372B6C1A